MPCGFTVGFDKRAATIDATQHLIVLGHRRFGLLSAPTEGNERALERGAGVAAALAQAGLTLPDAYRRCGAISLGSASTLMHGPRALPQRPTAVVATHDVFAVGSLLACREAGVRIPDDLSITGVDNTDLGATQAPGLTSVRTPITQNGRAAAEQVVARIEGREVIAFRTLPFESVKRGSTAPPLAA